MAVMGADFSILAEVQLTPQNMSALEGTIKESFPEAFVNVRVASTAQPAKQEQPRLVRTIQLTGPDDFGLLGRFAEYLAKQGFNIVDVSSELVPGSHIGYDTFDTTVEASMPAETDLDALSRELNKLGDELGVEISMY